MMGDRATADQHFSKYIEVRKASGRCPGSCSRKPVEVLDGPSNCPGHGGFREDDRSAGFGRVRPPSADIVARAIRRFENSPGKRRRTRRSTRSTPQPASVALIARFLTSPPAPLQNLATASSGADAFRRQLLGYSLLLHRNYSEAAQLWTEVYNKTSAVSANEERLLLAWAQAGRNNLAEVANLMRTHPCHRPVRTRLSSQSCFPALYS